MSGSAASDLRAAAAGLGKHLVEIRRAIHRHPELGLETPLTQQRICDELARIGVGSISLGKRCTSVVAEIVGEGGNASRHVALRADMDALPVREKTDAPFASATEGRMHACGHDAHVAMLLGAAELLHARRGDFAGTIRLLFQPGEEGYGGARIMIEEGSLDGVAAAFALHVDPSRRAHAVACRTGPMLAAFDDFRVVFRGAGGHASTPHNTCDPIPAIGPFVDGLSHVAARETDPDDRVVFSVTIVRAGTADNVIPSEAMCAGTIRTLSVKARERASERLQRVARGVAAARGLEADVRLVAGYPPTVNEAAAVGVVEASARALDLPIEPMPAPFMGAEDFSYVLERVPGAFVFLGARTDFGGPLHSDVMNIDESVLASGAALHATTALLALESFSGVPDAR